MYYHIKLKNTRSTNFHFPGPSKIFMNLIHEMHTQQKNKIKLFHQFLRNSDSQFMKIEAS